MLIVKETLVNMKEIIANLNNTYTVIMNDGWSVTANATELEKSFNECYNITLLPYFRILHDEQA